LTYNPRLEGYEINIGEQELKNAPKFSTHETWDWTAVIAPGRSMSITTCRLGAFERVPVGWSLSVSHCSATANEWSEPTLFGCRESRCPAQNRSHLRRVRGATVFGAMDLRAGFASGIEPLRRAKHLLYGPRKVVVRNWKPMQPSDNRTANVPNVLPISDMVMTSFKCNHEAL
jgi:hypothetical protein